MLSGRDLCDGPITRPEKSYGVWCVSQCHREASITRKPWPTTGCRSMGGGGVGNRAVASIGRTIRK
jgi:hypothetical protein